MKKKILFFVMGVISCISASADNYYPDDDVVIPAKTETSTDYSSKSEMETIGYFGLGFYSYDGGENYSLSFGAYNFDGFGFGMNIRSNYKFKDNQNTYNADVLLNYSMGIFSNGEVAFMITPEIGPSIAGRYAYDKKDGKAKEKYYIDGFVGIKGTFAFKAVTLSAGYHIWAPQWKFGKNEKADGFYAQLGFDF